MPNASDNRGFTYLGLLILVGIISVAATASLQVGAVMQRRAAEEELLVVGMEFRNALASFASATLPGQPSAPAALDDLLRDTRHPGLRRHLRKLYADPVTGRAEWGLVLAPDGKGIIGIHSLSTAKPIKNANFPAGLEGFAGRRSYADWEFPTH